MTNEYNPDGKEIRFIDSHYKDLFHITEPTVRHLPMIPPTIFCVLWKMWMRTAI